MVNQETDVANYFSTTLSLAVTDAALTFPVDSIGNLSSPAYIVIDPDDVNKREVILADGAWGASSFVTSVITNRGLEGSVVGATSHDAGAVVVVTPLAQHLDDLHDRIEAHDHSGGTAGTAVSIDHGDAASLDADHHTQYLLTSGIRAMAGDLNLANNSLVDFADKINALGNQTGTVTPNISSGTWITMTLTGNVTIDLSDMIAGQAIVFDISQDGTGGRTVGFTQAVEWNEGEAFVHTGTANSRDRIVIDYDGTTYTGHVSGQAFA